MDSDRYSWQNYWQAGSAGSYFTETRRDEEVLQSPTTPHYSVPNSDSQTMGGESWQELEYLPRLLDDPDASWSLSGLEDLQSNAFSSGQFESIENATPSQFQVDLDENSAASSEPWKNFSMASDGGVETTAPGSENQDSVLISRLLCDSSSEVDPGSHGYAFLKPRRYQNKIDGLKKTGKRHRAPNWTPEENQAFLQLMGMQKGKSPWKAISDGLKGMGFFREVKACEDHWGVLLADLKKFGNHFGSDDILRDLHFWPSVRTMSREERSQNGLPLVFEEEWFPAMARIVHERSQHRKPRRKYFKGVIDGAGTPSSSSCRQQPRVSAAASATPSSEIFDNSVGGGDGISGLVKLLEDSSDRNVTVDQTIEVRRMRLEVQRLHTELERYRMYCTCMRANEGAN